MNKRAGEVLFTKAEVTIALVLGLREASLRWTAGLPI